MTLQFDQSKLNQIFKSSYISSASIFGSYARDEQTPTSDIDLLVSFNKRISLFDLARTQIQLEEFFGKEVDLVIEKNLKERVKPYILKDLKLLYEER